MTTVIKLRNPETILLTAEVLSAGPAAFYAQNLMSGLSRVHVDHPMLTPEVPGIGLLNKHEAARVQPARGLKWLNWRPLVFSHVLEWVREHNPELLHGIAEDAAGLTSKLADALLLPYILTVHSFMDRERLRISKRCKAVIAVSEPLREHLVNDHRIAKELVRVIPQAVPHIPAPEERDNANQLLAERLEADRTADLVVSVGDFSSKSDFATFLEAARSVSDRAEKLNKPCSFIVAGEGPKESTLRAFTRELRLDKTLTFVHGHTEIERLLQDASIYVQTSRREGFAVRALQALACGVPVVAATNGAVLELLDDGVTGFIVPAGNHEALYEKVLKLLEDPALRKQMGAAGRKVAREQFSIEKMLTPTLQIYRDCVQS